MLREVETQQPAANSDADRVVTRTRYDSKGQKVREAGPYTVMGTKPSGTYYAPALAQVLDNHRFTYDGAGRLRADVYQASTTLGAYWSSYTYDGVGNRRTEVKHVKSGSNDTTVTYGYPASGANAAAPGGSTAAGGPHAVTSISTAVGTGTAKTATYGYDESGNMTARDGHSLTWDSEGNLTKTVKGSSTIANVYDADGNRLVRQDGSTTTLYLDSTEIRLTSPADGPQTKVGQRWYTFNGKVVATRTGSSIQMLASDYHDTGMVQIDPWTGNYIKRRFDPFGQARAGAGTVASWAGDRGFLDKSTDANGLTQIGARYYDAAMGRFISVDPMLVVDDPRQTNPYTYAGNNPMTLSDPTGESLPPAVDASGGGTVDGTGGGSGRDSGGGSGGGSSSNGSGFKTGFPVVDSAASSAWSVARPLSSDASSFGLGFLAAVDQSLTTGPRHRKRLLGFLADAQAKSRRAARDVRASGFPEKYKIGRLLNRVADYDRAGKIISSGPVKSLGAIGTLVGATVNYQKYRDEGDSRTKSILKVGIRTGIAAGTASAFSAAGVACGPFAPACGAASGTFGAWLGDRAGGAMVGRADPAIGWTADHLDSGAAAVRNFDYSFWN